MHLEEELARVLENLVLNLEIEKYFGVNNLVSSRTKHSKEKIKFLIELNKRVKLCKKCVLHKGRKNVVFGEGSVFTKILFVGEAPGREEDLTGRPFVGLAGDLLGRIIEAMGLLREEVYITNVLKCRPPQNRAPRPEEIDACSEFLRLQIKTINPKVIVALGKYAANFLTNTEKQIGGLRGHLFFYEGIKVIPTFHPAYLLRNPAEKKKAWQDFKKARAILHNEF